MARDYLAIPASSASVERIFSSAADTVTPDRTHILAETISVIMCLKHWYCLNIFN